MAVEQIALAGGTARPGGGDEWFEKFLHILRVAMIRVQGHEDIILGRQGVHRFRQHDGTERHVLHCRS